MATTKVYKAGKPLKRKWVLAWHTPVMSGIAFWYFDTKREAIKAALRMNPNHEW